MLSKKKAVKDIRPNIANNLNVVGVGASAGGLKAIQELFDNIPKDTGFAFVLIQHLSPDYKSMMAELLAKHTSMMVLEATEDMRVTPNCVYLIPSKKIIRLKNGVLKLEDKIKTAQPTLAIDIFFESLAKEKGINSIGIILSGTGTDGTKGIEAIKSAGGIVIVQDPITAEFDGMPKSAINTGYADLILSPEMMADELMDFINEAPLIKSFNELNKRDELLLHEILAHVHSVTSNDFSKYKLPTINRRLARRMLEKNQKTIEEYYRYVLTDPDEAKILSKEFLINVTKFFRDGEAFDLLAQKVIPGLFANKKNSDVIKVWSVACSTGEEAYSLAILFQEYMESHTIYDVSLKIFATDIDADALAVASRGAYSADALKDVSEDRVNKYFVKDGSNYTVVPAIRKMVILARHDIAKDPPFSKIDLLTCRNMLIYMNPVLQKLVLNSFYFALNEGGFLFLGPSENLGLLKDYLVEIDKKWKIYTCEAKGKLMHGDSYFAPLTRESFTSLGPNKPKNALNHIADIFKETLLEEYHYTGIYIDKDFEVKQAVGNFRMFLNFPQESFNFNLLKLVPADLAVALGISVRKAIQTNETVVTKRVRIGAGDNRRFVSIVIKPYLVQKNYLQPFLFVVLSEEVADVALEMAPAQVVPFDESARVKMLERELAEAKENLQAVIEEVESANEELQSSNEEIVSANEELQSTNEELQSLNEELHTVNAEHQAKIKEMIELNDDLNNYFNNSQIGQILVDKDMIIRKFSPAATRQINLIESDIGRSIAHISANFSDVNFVQEIKAVMRSEVSSEKELSVNDGKSYLMRISPYVRLDRTFDGVVINFIDITESKSLNEIVRGVFNSSPNRIVALTAIKDSAGKIVDFEIMAANNKSLEILKEDKGALVGKKLIADGALQVSGFFEQLVTAAEDSKPFHSELQVPESGNWYDLDAIQMKDGLVITFADTTDRKTAEAKADESYKQAKEASENLVAANYKLEQTNYDLMQFASVASHDLKEPLRKVLVYGNFLKEKIEHTIGEQENKYLGKILAASQRMQALIDDILNLSKLSNEGFEMEPVNMNEVINQIIDDLDITIKEKNARIYIDGLTPIRGVPGQLRQLMQNLIINSLKFNDKEMPVIIIKERKVSEAEAEELGIVAENYVSIDLSDNGIGFEDQYKEKIFGLFQRLDGSHYQGTGIGLAICKKIVDNHKGFIRVKSKPEEGTVFKLILPVSPVAASQHKTKALA